MVKNFFGFTSAINDRFLTNQGAVGISVISKLTIIHLLSIALPRYKLIYHNGYLPGWGSVNKLTLQCPSWNSRYLKNHTIC